MVIDKIGGINNINRLKKASAPVKARPEDTNDSLSISSEAQKLSQVEQIKQEVLKASDIRQDKINEIKQRIADGSFEKDLQSDEYIGKVADKMADVLLNPLE